MPSNFCFPMQQVPLEESKFCPQDRLHFWMSSHMEKKSEESFLLRKITDIVGHFDFKPYALK